MSFLTDAPKVGGQNMRMTFANYEKKIEELKTMPNLELSGDYGITESDLERIREGGEKYVSYLMYLSTRPWYDLEVLAEKKFENDDAIPSKKAAELIDELLYELVELVDDED